MNGEVIRADQRDAYKRTRQPATEAESDCEQRDRHHVQDFQGVGWIGVRRLDDVEPGEKRKCDRDGLWTIEDRPVRHGALMRQVTMRTHPFSSCTTNGRMSLPRGVDRCFQRLDFPQPPKKRSLSLAPYERVSNGGRSRSGREAGGGSDARLGCAELRTR